MSFTTPKLAANPPLAAVDISIPQFSSSTVADFLRDGYWLEAPDITGNSAPDLVGHWFKAGELYWYEEPHWGEAASVGQD